MSAAVTAKRSAATTPVSRVHSGKTAGADHRERGRPKGDASAIGGDARLKPGRVAREHEALAGDEDDEAGGDEVAPPRHELDREQSGRDDERHAVDEPKLLPQSVRADERASHAESAADRGDDVERLSRAAVHLFPPPKR
jgi:hypothetical protein